MAGRSKKLNLGVRRKKQSAERNSDLKGLIIRFCKDRGADLVGFAPVERWDKAGEVPPDFRPQAIWSPARTVIVIGMEMPLPIVETTPSILHKETYDTSNRELDQLAYDLTRYLNRLGHASFSSPGTDTAASRP